MTYELIWKKSSHPMTRMIMLWLVPVIILISVISYYFYSARYVVTDNAYVMADIVQVAPEAGGSVTKVLVANNQKVKKGDVLIAIDSIPYEYKLNQAQMEVLQASIDVEKLKAAYKISEIKLKKAKSDLQFAQLEFDRSKKLVADKAIANNSYDKSKNNLDDCLDAVEIAEKEMLAALVSLNNEANSPTENHPLYRLAKAKLLQAELDMSYTQVRAPNDGIIGNLYIQPGDTVIAYYPMFALVKTEHIWIEANIKENDLTNIKPGQNVEISVDTYPQKPLRGVVESIAPATGATFALLPAQNSSGNWVKVVQRVMVKVTLTDDMVKSLARPLVVGMSTEIKIDTKSTPKN